MKINVISGPNINLLGNREKNHYGDITYDNLKKTLLKEGDRLNVDIDFFQSNYEGKIVDYIQKNVQAGAFIVNAAAYTHTSVAIRDALIAAKKPFVEVHLSNIFAREHFRHKSFLADIADGVVAGLGIHSYLSALYYLANKYS
jgi:3-dehydroquinate dehydratase-2